MAAVGGRVVGDDAADLTFDFEKEMPPEEPIITKRPELCQAYRDGHCRNGASCPDRHNMGVHKSLQISVCKHWLRGGCVNGNDCMFLHEFEERFIPNCAWWNRCNNPECTFKHKNPEEEEARCAAFERGFCPLGPNCRLRHVKREACSNFLAGFCPNGPRCPKAHPVMTVYDKHSVFERTKRSLEEEHRGDSKYNPRVTCYKCQDPGHIPKHCPGVPYGRMFQSFSTIREPGEEPLFERNRQGDGWQIRGCFFCGSTEHRMRECPDRPPPEDRRRDRFTRDREYY